MTSIHKQRRDRIKQTVCSLNADAFLVSSLVNVRYLCGFTGSNGFLVISKDGDFLITDSRYLEQGSEETNNEIAIFLSSGVRGLTELPVFNQIKTLVIESSNLTYSEFKFIEELVGDRLDLLPKNGLIEKIRAIKNRDEIDNIRRAAALADEALKYAFAVLRPGNTEAEVSWIIEKFLRENGADGLAFDSIVATGVNASKPHHRAGNTMIQSGDPLVIDMGASLNGYRSDITRTVLVDGQNEQFQSIYDTVLEAQMAAIGAIREGISGNELDSIAREVITSHGFGKNFSHGLGHGVGLDVHELPMIVPSSETLIENGMIFTVEPGIYISGWGGVRIEDMILLESDQVSLLTNYPK